MTTKLRLFTSPSAFPNPQRLRIFMHEKGIADQFNEHVYDMTPVGEQRQWRHLKMNPWGETPTLKIADGSFISETAAIARYLDQSMPGKTASQEPNARTRITAKQSQATLLFETFDKAISEARIHTCYISK